MRYAGVGDELQQRRVIRVIHAQTRPVPSCAAHPPHQRVSTAIIPASRTPRANCRVERRAKLSLAHSPLSVVAGFRTRDAHHTQRQRYRVPSTVQDVLYVQDVSTYRTSVRTVPYAGTGRSVAPSVSSRGTGTGSTRDNGRSLLGSAPLACGNSEDTTSCVSETCRYGGGSAEARATWREVDMMEWIGWMEMRDGGTKMAMERQRWQWRDKTTMERHIELADNHHASTLQCQPCEYLSRYSQISDDTMLSFQG